MDLIWNRFDRSLIERGDHIYCYRNAHVYSHHGIYIGHNKVIHFTRTEDDDDTDGGSGSGYGSSSGSAARNCSHCCPEKPRGVVECCLDCFLNGHGLYRFEYGVSESHFLSKRSGTCTIGEACFSRDETVQRATAILNQPQGFGKYNLLYNNCEVFAVYCKTGLRESSQVHSLRDKAKNLFHDVTGHPFSLQNFGHALFNVATNHKLNRLSHDKILHAHKLQDDGDDDGDDDDDER